jgi:hypothetical protein
LTYGFEIPAYLHNEIEFGEHGPDLGFDSYAIRFS